NLPLVFERNIGQGDPSVTFEAYTFSGSLAFKRDSIEFSLPDPSGNVATVRLRYLGSNPHAQLAGQNRGPTITNYFLGSQPKNWLVDVPTYHVINYSQLYPGIDLRYDGSASSLKGTYIVAAGANPASIRWSYSGVSQIQI